MSELDATKPSDVDWGYLTELFRETEKPIRKDENVFYEFSSAMFANFKHILAEREQMRAKLEAAQKCYDALKILHDENMDYIKLNNLGAENNQSLRMAREALAAYNKEQP